MSRLFHLSRESTRRVLCGLPTTHPHVTPYLYYVHIDDVGQLRGRWDGPFIHRWHENDAVCVSCIQAAGLSCPRCYGLGRVYTGEGTADCPCAGAGRVPETE